MYEVRDSSPECQAATAQEWPGGATERPRSGVAGRSHLTPEASGSDPEEPTTHEARARSREEQPEERWLSRHRRDYRSYPTLKARNGGGKETPLIQCKEQWLCFVGAAVKRYPTPKVRETQVRW